MFTDLRTTSYCTNCSCAYLPYPVGTSLTRRQCSGSLFRASPLTFETNYCNNRPKFWSAYSSCIMGKPKRLPKIHIGWPYKYFPRYRSKSQTNLASMIHLRCHLHIASGRADNSTNRTEIRELEGGCTIADIVQSATFKLCKSFRLLKREKEFPIKFFQASAGGCSFRNVVTQDIQWPRSLLIASLTGQLTCNKVQKAIYLSSSTVLFVQWFSLPRLFSTHKVQWLHHNIGSRHDTGHWLPICTVYTMGQQGSGTWTCCKRQMFGLKRSNFSRTVWIANIRERYRV